MKRCTYCIGFDCCGLYLSNWYGLVNKRNSSYQKENIKAKQFKRQVKV